MSRIRPLRMSRREQVLCAHASGKAVYDIGQNTETVARERAPFVPPFITDGAIRIAAALKRERRALMLAPRSRFRRRGA